MIKKLPWGIIAGICLILLVLTVIGTVAAYIILNAIAEQTSASVTLFAEWYQVVLFVADVLFALGLIGSVVMYALRKVRESKEGASE